MRRFLPALGWLLLVIATVDWFALRGGILDHAPSVLASIVASTVAAFSVRVFWLVWRLTRESRRRVGTLAEIGVLVGILLALLGGMTNWLLGLQGFVILNERETIRLHGGTQLQAFEAGPLARLEEMGLFLALDEVDLAPEGAESFLPVSVLRVWSRGEEPVRVQVSPRKAAAVGPLRFHQGAFGFAPRIVILDGERTLFDRVVPFTTERRGASGISFDGRFTVERESLALEGAVDLASLDEGLRGHATLVLAVSRDGQPLGRGTLLPGHFADLTEGYRVGFAGLRQWSEIVISRRNYTRVVLAGAALALVGLILWPIASWRGW